MTSRRIAATRRSLGQPEVATPKRAGPLARLSGPVRGGYGSLDGAGSGGHETGRNIWQAATLPNREDCRIKSTLRRFFSAATTAMNGFCEAVKPARAASTPARNERETGLEIAERQA